MPSLRMTQAKRWFYEAIMIAGIAAGGIVVAQQSGAAQWLTSYLVRKPLPSYQWKVLEQKDVASGAVIPADTHVVFHLPATLLRINREVLLGQKGETTRYWGYCFPENDEPAVVNSRTGFPGLIFLSEKERAIRAAIAARQASRYSPTSQLPNSIEAEQLNNPIKPAIRHQLEVFKPNTMCYIMTEASLSIGLDADNDRLNDELEREVGTDSAVPDTDGDGIMDGVEYTYDLAPLIRDTDTDGIIDGIEDANWNGRIDIGETDPRVRDSDRDGLCDGMCRIRLKKRDIFMGEDKNLNGVVDDGETDPRKYSTQGNDVSDEVLFLQCVAAGKDVCP
jgi:hypothetical protein